MSLVEEIETLMGKPLWDALGIAKTSGDAIDPRVALEHQIAGLQAAVKRLAEEVGRER
jgi:hypothetical protein